MHSNNHLQLPLGRTFNRLSRLYLGALSSKLDHLEIDRYYTVLMVIENNYPHTSQKELAHHIGVDKASMVRMLNYLTQHGYIIRESEEDDKRQHRVRLTPKATTRMRQIHEAVADLNEFCAKKVSRSEWKTFLRVLDVMKENLLSLPMNDMVIQIRKRKNAPAKN